MSPISMPALPDLSSANPTDAVAAKAAFAAAKKILDVQREMGAQLVQLIDPSLGQNFDRRA